MTEKLLEYALVNGFIHNWLVAGPLATKAALAAPPAPPTEPPDDRAAFKVEGQILNWAYYRCLQDHFIDCSTEEAIPGVSNAWAYAQLHTPVAESAALTVYGSGAVQVWLNGKILEPSHQGVSSGHPYIRNRFQAALQAENELFIRFEAVGGRTNLHTLAVRLDDFITDHTDQVVVRLPTRAMFPHRHKIFESLFDYAYLERAVHHKGNLINLRWAEDAAMTSSYAYKVRDSRKQIYVEGNAEVKLEPYDCGHPQRIWEHPYHIALQAPGFEFWEQDCRYERILPFYILDTECTSKPRESFVRRRELALEHAQRREPQLFAEIAKMAAEAWEKVNPGFILGAVKQVQDGAANRDLLLVGLLGSLQRYRAQEKFPQAVVKPIEACILAYDYKEPVAGGQAILRQAAAILAGGLYPRRRFKAANLSGANLRQEAEAAAIQWMSFQGAQGLSAWTAPEEIEQVVVALTHLTSLAEDEMTRELAAVLLDKILFLLASLSHQGIFGTAHASLGAAAARSAQMNAVSGISRLLFGMGVYNPHIAGPVSLVCSSYEFPAFFRQIAANPPGELLHKERQIAPSGDEFNLVAYRTPDTLLSSVQDYRPGQAGAAEHVWQATLGADAVVFTNHPIRISEQEGQQPGFWLGNGILPRLAQWKDSVVAIYNLPEEDWLGFTHAHFPTYAFDEVVFARGWAFARLGEGFLGITCSEGFELVKHGPGAFRELRSSGRQNVWLCITGRKALYRGFRKFQKACMAIKPEWSALGVAFRNLQGDAIEFGWEGDFIVNGQAQPLKGFKHIENPYCVVELGAAQMDIQHGETLLRLNFE